MDYKIAIPSHARPIELLKKTLKMLSSYEIDLFNDVFIFVSPDEVETYKKILPAMNIIEGALGIKQNRKAISDYFDEGQIIVSIDDDITGIHRLQTLTTGKQKLVKLECLKSQINKMIEDLKKYNYSLAGFYPIDNPYFMKNHTSTDLKFIIGNFKVFINKKNLEYRKFTLLEDYETTIKYFFNDGGVLRYNNIVAETKYKILKWDLTDDDKMKEVNLFYFKYCDYCFIKKKKDTIDINFKKGKKTTLTTYLPKKWLNKLTTSCLKSWIKQGYNIFIYTDSIELNELPLWTHKYIEIFKYNGNTETIKYDILRNNISSTWIDCDIFLLDRLPTSNIILSSEYTHRKSTKFSDIVLRLDSKLGKELLDENNNNLTELLKKKKYNPLNGYSYSPDAWCPIPWWNGDGLYSKHDITIKFGVVCKGEDYIIKNSIGIKFWNKETYIGNRIYTSYNTGKNDYSEKDKNSLYYRTIVKPNYNLISHFKD